MMDADRSRTPQARGKRLLPAALGVLCLLAGFIAWYEALPTDSSLRPTLSIAEGCLALAFLLLLGDWFAGRPSRPAHAAAVFCRILYILNLFVIACSVIRDLEIRIVTRDTWICIGILIAGILAFNGKRILSAARRNAFRRRANHVATGRICQILGETHLDLDGDPATLYNVTIEYEVDGVLYQTRAEISRRMVRKFGRDAFVGRTVPVFYDPAEPACAFANRIDRHFFDA